jgi:hypothetical protein
MMDVDSNERNVWSGKGGFLVIELTRTPARVLEPAGPRGETSVDPRGERLDGEFVIIAVPRSPFCSRRVLVVDDAVTDADADGNLDFVVFAAEAAFAASNNRGSSSSSWSAKSATSSYRR